jgi:tetratricopeptide (TPR) repeat protein
MTSSVETTRQTAGRGEELLGALVGWMSAHRQATIYLAGAAIVAAILGGWSLLSAREAEQRAAEQLSQARFAFESENLPLAASEFARITANYAGTRAAEEATILLAQVRLRQGQPQQALDVLRDFAPRADDAYAAQAFGLLGAGYENLGRSREAAEAYEQAARRAQWPFLAAQLLSDAGRAWIAAGEKEQALRVYRRIVTEYEETGPVVEAKVRIGELTAGG